jgi:hypothetical protein
MGSLPEGGAVWRRQKGDKGGKARGPGGNKLQALIGVLKGMCPNNAAAGPLRHYEVAFKPQWADGSEMRALCDLRLQKREKTRDEQADAKMQTAAGEDSAQRQSHQPAQAQEPQSRIRQAWVAPETLQFLRLRSPEPQQQHACFVRSFDATTVGAAGLGPLMGYLGDAPTIPTSSAQFLAAR